MRSWNKKFPDLRKSYVITDSPNGPAGGRFIEWCRVFGTTPLTCTNFDPRIFLRNSVRTSFHIFPTSLKFLILGNYSDFGLKIAHRGNTGSHTGATQALTKAGECLLVCLKNGFVHYYSFFSVFGLWHKANSAHFSGSNEKMFPN